MPKKVNPEDLQERLHIGACVYPPQASHNIVPLSSDAPGSAPVVPSSYPVFSQNLPDEVLSALDHQVTATQTEGLSHADWARELALHLGNLVGRGADLGLFLAALSKEAATDPLLATLWGELESRTGQGSAAPSVMLAPRERQVLELAASGKSNIAIAEALGIKPVTVTKALSRAYAKLGAKNRSEAVSRWLLSKQD